MQQVLTYPASAAHLVSSQGRMAQCPGPVCASSAVLAIRAVRLESSCFASPPARSVATQGAASKPAPQQPGLQGAQPKTNCPPIAIVCFGSDAILVCKQEILPTRRRGQRAESCFRLILFCSSIFPLGHAKLQNMPVVFGGGGHRFVLSIVL